MLRHFRIGTRGSRLALYQAHKVQDELNVLFPEMETEIVIIHTKGDKILDVALSKIGDKGLFTKELEVALFEQEIDIAVHSFKDMPTQLEDGLDIGAVLERGEVRDALVCKAGLSLQGLSASHKIGTSSLRRKASLLKYSCSAQIVDIRGNVNTRLQKMSNGHCDAMIMAAAGLERLGLEKHITQYLDPLEHIPAVAQGIICAEYLSKRIEVKEILNRLNHNLTWQIGIGERMFMKTLQGGCQVPVGCYAQLNDATLSLTGFVASVDGQEYLRHKVEGPLDQSEFLGAALADELLMQGGTEILNEIR